jgi:predicted nucleic acid-binding protein
MILADTSVWVSHLRKSERRLAAVLTDGLILVHPFVIGEIACGNLENRSTVLTNLQELPQARTASHGEVLHLVERHRLWGRGIGWIDAHLLASARVTGCRLWTLDRRLDAVARQLGLNL